MYYRINKKFIVNIIFNGVKLNVFFLLKVERKGSLFLLFLINILLEDLIEVVG